MTIESTQERLDTLVGSNKVVLFMKGTREMPQCGFSAATVSILDSLVPDYATVNVLEDQTVREGIKAYSSWPTIPQLYIDNEFVGGCDIIKQMFNSGALHDMLGAPPPDRTPPAVNLGDDAAELMRNVLASQPEMSVHLQIDARWQHNFTLGRAEGHEVRADSNGLAILMDVATAQKAKGLVIGVEQTLQGTGFKIDNPNAPPPVNQMTVGELKGKLDAGDPLSLFDVRPPDERARASIPGARPFDDAAQSAIEALPKDALIVFHCHLGQRSQTAAEHFRLNGYTNVQNLAGGINAWSEEIDPSIPRY